MRSSIAVLAVAAAWLTATTSAHAAIVINEVESEGTDFIELTNTGPGAVDLGGWVLKDSGDANPLTIPDGTVLPAGGFFSARPAFGLGSADSVRVFAKGDLATPVETFSWTSHPSVTYGRCPDGSGPMTATSASTETAANACVATTPWPGGVAIADADDFNAFGTNLSGLAYQPSGTSARGVLWAVKNGPSMLYRLVHDGTRWVNDTTNGWGAGKQLVYPDGAGVPDAEGLALVDSDPNAIYVSTERNDVGGGASRPAVLRYATSGGAGGPLIATHDWNLTADLPGLGANAGLEAIAWVPDALLVAKGFFDEARGAAYNPADYAGHGTGLFLVGVEQDGRILAYALSANGAATRVATIASGFPAVMALEYEPESTHLWAVCDDTCGGRTATLDIDGTGRFAVTKLYARPLGMPLLNNEGFTIAPQAECANAFKPVFWTDDSGTGGHAIRSGTIACTVPGGGPGPDPTPTPTPDPTPQPATPTPTSTPTPSGTPGPSTDRTAPRLRVAFKLPKTGAYAVRRTGKLRVTITLSEPANLTLTATARKSANARARTLVTVRRPLVPAGSRSYTLTLSKRVRAALRKGERVTLTVQARDAAGNLATSSAAAKVP